MRIASAQPATPLQSNQVAIEAVAKGLHFAEGPVWSLDDFLLFSDTATDRLLKVAPGKPMAEVATNAGGISGQTYDTKGNLYTCEFRARRVTRTDKKGKIEVMAERFEGKRLNAPNDIVVRRDGNIYFTDPAFGNQQDTRELDFDGVFRVTSRGELQAIARWKTRPNGIALSPDGKLLYVTNADEQNVHAFDLDRNGVASNDRIVVAKMDGAPGGIRTDEAGNLYIAARNVFVYSPTGQLLRTIDVSETPSNLAWGDPDFGTLYVTARTSVYRVKLGIKGSVGYLP
ncbi:MAG: SMP-30/gluconolactonase/LRE family protein [Acidobacteriota bacterium]